MREPMFCPFCGTTAIATSTSVFFEFGEFDGNAYTEEGDIDVYRCTREGCGEPFANLAGYDLASAVDDESHPLPPCP